MSDEDLVKRLKAYCPYCAILLEDEDVKAWDYDQFNWVEVYWECWNCGHKFKTYHESVEEE